MKSRLTLNRLVAGLQTFFLCMTLYAGEKGIMGYASEKMALAIFFSIIGLYLTKRRVHSNRKFKGLIVLVGIMLAEIIYSYLHSYAPNVTYSYLLRFIFVFAFVFICYDTKYLLKLCDYLQNFGIFIAVAYIVTWPIMGQAAGLYMSYQYTGQMASFATAFTIPKLFSKEYKFRTEMSKLLIILLAILITGKRTLFVIPLLMVLVVMALSDDYSKYRKIFLLGIAAIVGLGILSAIMPSALNSITRLLEVKDDTSMSSRVYFWDYALMLWSKNKLHGIGFGCFPEHIATGGVNLAKYHYIQAWSAHNIYYQMLAEIGMIGTTIFCGVFLIGIIYTLYWLKKAKKLQLTNCSRIAMIALYCQLWFVIYGFTGNPLCLPGQFFIEFFGLVLISSVRNEWNTAIKENKKN